MNPAATFTVEKRQLLNVLKQLKKLEKSGRKKDSTLELTIFDGYIRLNIPGIELIVHYSLFNSDKFTKNFGNLQVLLSTKCRRVKGFGDLARP